MNKDIKDILKLIAILLVLIVLAWCINFFSRVDIEDKKRLFSQFELSTWKEVEINDMRFKLSEENNSPFQLDQQQWLKIQDDFSQIYVLEVASNADDNLIKEFSNLRPAMVIHGNFDESPKTYFLGNINSTTGNFWIKVSSTSSVKYYLCVSEIYFEGFYQSESEGKNLSYKRLENYFLQPFKSWYGKNFWSDLKSVSLKTKKNTLFSLTLKDLSFLPLLPKDVLLDTDFFKLYFSQIKNWIPYEVKDLKDTQSQDLSFEQSDFFLELVYGEKLNKLELSINDNGLYWKENKLILSAPKEFLDKLLILPDGFYQKKIASLSELWEKLQKDNLAFFHWTKLKDQTKLKVNFETIKKNKIWNDFFCLISACLPEGYTSVMKVNEIGSAEVLQWIKQADFKLEYINSLPYYFKHDPYKLQVLTPHGVQFTFISRIKDIIP